MDLHSTTKDNHQVEQRLLDAIATLGDFPGTAGKGYYALGEDAAATDLRMRMDAEQDEIDRTRLPPSKSARPWQSRRGRPVLHRSGNRRREIRLLPDAALLQLIVASTIPPVTYTALVWVAFSILVLVSPSDARVPGLIVLGLILVGGLHFATMLVVNRAVLESEPGKPGAF